MSVVQEKKLPGLIRVSNARAYSSKLASRSHLRIRRGRGDLSGRGIVLASHDSNIILSDEVKVVPLRIAKS